MPTEVPRLGRRLVAEGLGAFFLFATVIGSGIMAETLSGGNAAVALLGNTLATGAILFVLITMLGPISGAHSSQPVRYLRRHCAARCAAVHRRAADRRGPGGGGCALPLRSA